VRKILIVGAGQAGLQLANGLASNGYDVTVVSNRTPEQIRDGRVLSSQCMFGNALQHERDVGLGFWDDECPPVEGLSFSVPAPDGSGKAIFFEARLDRPAQSVDQRVKMPRWLEELERRGGRVVVHEATPEDLERYTQENDLVVVAAGKGDITSIFERDAERSTYDKPMRALALTYIVGMTPRPEFTAVNFNLAPGVGEYFVFPALTTSGPCEIMVFEGIPGGPMDCWGDVETPQQHLERSVEILDRFFPWEAERNRSVELTDDNGILTGRFPPTVRRPVGELASGGLVLGLADVVVLNDPITGQGSNNASHCAALYLEAILERGDEPFDRAWMEETFERYWDYAQYVSGWTNALLGPPPEHVLNLLGAAGQNERIAKRFVEGFDDPRDFFDWFMTPDKAEAYLAAVAS
jgi:hypothetical protein